MLPPAGRFSRTVATVLAVVTLVAATVCADDTSPTNLPHPDGVTGHLAVFGELRFNSQYSDAWVAGRDYQRYSAGIRAVLQSRLSLTTRFLLVDQFQRRYEIDGFARFYFRDPAIHRDRVNADGPVGGPILSLGGGSSFFGQGGGSPVGIFEGAADLPLSTRLTVGAGLRHYQDRPEDEPIGVYGRISVYLWDYPADSAWSNPDGPVGRPALRFTLGGSSIGSAGRGEVVVPLTVHQTVRAVVAVARISDPTRTTYSIGLGTTVYLHP